MPTLTRNVTIPQTVDNTQTLTSVRIYFADASATVPNQPRIEFRLKNASGDMVTTVDRPLSDFSNNPTAASTQKAVVRATLDAWLTQMYTLEGFA